MLTRYELLCASVSSMYHDIQKIERVEMEKFGLKGPHAQCLLTMRRFPEGLTAGQLCAFCEKDKAAVSRTVSELESAGMLIRADRNGNRYRALLTLSEQGIQAAEAVSSRALKAVERAGTGLEDQQRQVFYQVLSLIAENLHTLCRDGLPK